VAKREDRILLGAQRKWRPVRLRGGPLDPGRRVEDRRGRRFEAKPLRAVRVELTEEGGGD